MVNEGASSIPDILSMEMKKVDKADFQPINKQQKLNTDAKKVTTTQNKESSPYKHRNPNKKQKYSPSKNIDPLQITSILKGRKEEATESLSKKYKVTFDENLNLEHTLSNSELSLSSNDNNKKQYPVMTSPKKVEQKLTSPTKILGNTSPNKKTSPKKSPTKTRNVDPELAILANNPYTPITELSFSRTESPENVKFCGVDIKMNTKEFYKSVFSLSENKNEISKYSSLSIDEWLAKGNELLEQKREITKQIMAARIRSSYAHKVITDQINARAEALQIWETTVQEQDKKFTSQMKMFLSEE